MPVSHPDVRGSSPWCITVEGLPGRPLERLVVLREYPTTSFARFAMLWEDDGSAAAFGAEPVPLNQVIHPALRACAEQLLGAMQAPDPVDADLEPGDTILVIRRAVLGSARSGGPFDGVSVRVEDALRVEYGRASTEFSPRAHPDFPSNQSRLIAMPDSSHPLYQICRQAAGRAAGLRQRIAAQRAPLAALVPAGRTLESLFPGVSVKVTSDVMTQWPRMFLRVGAADAGRLLGELRAWKEKYPPLPASVSSGVSNFDFTVTVSLEDTAVHSFVAWMASGNT